MRHRIWAGLAALTMLGGCAQAVPPPGASVPPPVRGRHAATPTRGFDCTTRSFFLFTTSSCGEDGGLHLFAPATE